MTKLNDIQLSLIKAAAANGGAPAEDFDHRTTAALIKRGLLTAEDRHDGQTRLLATAEGLSAVGKETPSRLAAGQVETPELPDNAASRPGSKTKLIRDMLDRPAGATVAEMAEAAGWMHHSVRGFMAGALKKKLGLTVVSEKTDTGRRYRLGTERVAG